MKAIATFQRNEKKYKLNSQQYSKFLKALNENMVMDSYGEHTISNIYFDTDNFDLIRTSLEKPIYKEKLRLRTYGFVRDDSPAFLEIKKKFDGIVYKRRVELKYKDVIDFIKNDEEIKCNSDSFEDRQIFKEIAYVYKMYNPKPKAIIAYDRCAYFSPNSELRLTIDRNIRYRDVEMDLRLGSQGKSILPVDECLVEIKAENAMPLWLTKVLSENKIYPISFSKYGEYYKSLVGKVGAEYVG